MNKLGDSDKRVQCHVIYLLVKIMKAPRMEDKVGLIIREVHLFLQRSKEHSLHRYYAVAFLNRVAVG